MNFWVPLYFAFGCVVGLFSAEFFQRGGLDHARSTAIGVVSGLTWPVMLPVYLLLWILDRIMNRPEKRKGY